MPVNAVLAAYAKSLEPARDHGDPSSEQIRPASYATGSGGMRTTGSVEVLLPLASRGGGELGQVQQAPQGLGCARQLSACLGQFGP
jgi:hypothetical protein